MCLSHLSPGGGQWLSSLIQTKRGQQLTGRPSARAPEASWKPARTSVCSHGGQQVSLSRSPGRGACPLYLQPWPHLGPRRLPRPPRGGALALLAFPPPAAHAPLDTCPSTVPAPATRGRVPRRAGKAGELAPRCRGQLPSRRERRQTRRCRCRRHLQATPGSPARPSPPRNTAPSTSGAPKRSSRSTVACSSRTLAWRPRASAGKLTWPGSRLPRPCSRRLFSIASPRPPRVEQAKPGDRCTPLRVPQAWPCGGPGALQLWARTCARGGSGRGRRYAVVDTAPASQSRGCDRSPAQ